MIPDFQFQRSRMESVGLTHAFQKQRGCHLVRINTEVVRVWFEIPASRSPLFLSCAINAIFFHPLILILFPFLLRLVPLLSLSLSSLLNSVVQANTSQAIAFWQLVLLSCSILAVGYPIATSPQRPKLRRISLIALALDTAPVAKS